MRGVYKAIAVSWHKTHRRTRWLSLLFNLDTLFLREPPPYLRSVFITLRALLCRPRVVVVQGTHGPLVMVVALLRRLLGYVLVVDVHSGMFVPFNWKSYLLTLPFSRFLRLADIVVLHDPVIAMYAVERGILRKEQIMVVYDPPVKCICGKSSHGEDVLTLVFPSGGLADEPLDRLVEIINGVGAPVRLVITGPHTPRRVGKVIYTGFLPRDEYLETLCNADLVLAFTDLEYTILGAGWEAIYCRKPLITSSTLTLRTAFRDAAIYLRSVEELPGILEKLRRDPSILARLKASAERLRKELMRRQQAQSMELMRRVLNKLRASPPKPQA